MLVGVPKKGWRVPQSGWLEELDRLKANLRASLKAGRSLGAGVARRAPHCVIQTCPLFPSAVSCARMYWRTGSNSNPTVDAA